MADFDNQTEGTPQEAVAADDTVQTQPAAEQQQQADPLEEIARDGGWTPKEEWRGNPDDWRDPREFIKYGMKRSRESAEELRGLRQSVTKIGRTAEILQQRAVEDARREVEARFADAVENKDHEGARSAREELSRLDTAATQPDVQQPVQDFMTRNGAWFGQNRAATALARQITAEAAAQGISPAEQLRMAEDAVKADFPQLFGQQPRPAAKAPAVNAPATRAAAPAQRAKGFADLPADAQRAGHDFVKRGMVKTLDDYAKVYLEENA